LNVLQLNQGDFHTPRQGGRIKDLLDVGVDGVGFGERLVEAVLTDDLAQRGLRDLVDGGVDVRLF
jgi:hypothetical protein